MVRSVHTNSHTHTQFDRLWITDCLHKILTGCPDLPPSAAKFLVHIPPPANPQQCMVERSVTSNLSLSPSDAAAGGTTKTQMQGTHTSTHNHMTDTSTHEPNTCKHILTKTDGHTQKQTQICTLRYIMSIFTYPRRVELMLYFFNKHPKSFL